MTEDYLVEQFAQDRQMFSIKIDFSICTCASSTTRTETTGKKKRPMSTTAKKANVPEEK